MPSLQRENTLGKYEKGLGFMLVFAARKYARYKRARGTRFRSFGMPLGKLGGSNRVQLVLQWDGCCYFAGGLFQ
jgi:hypothetical protein